MKNWRKFLKQRMAQGLMLLALGVFAQLTVQAQNSVSDSKNSGTGAAKRSEPLTVGEEEKRRRGEGESGANGSEPGTVVTGSTASRGQPPRPSATPPVQEGSLRDLINSCAAAVEDLARTRILADALERENALLKERLETEKRTSAVLFELNEARKTEAASLRETVAAKNETIVAKDGVIAAQDKLIETLKKKKTSPLKRFGDVLIGIGLMAVLR